ncbi:MAG: type 11 methyltransferase [Candidatus Peregrinibacteria bacterium Gr01-1014_25]|nr:MAG: type 11 methyltransferase [Candidatus Peregrinibacteria bacterium Gr01-1014_25]
MGVPCFLPLALRHRAEEERGDFVNAVKTLLRRSPLLYRWLIYLISPVCYVGMTAPRFLRSLPVDALVLNVGSGVHRYTTTMVNLDMYPYSGVDVVADATALPFPDNTFDGALCECLLEHVTRPELVVREILRVLKPGGRVYITVPFVYAFHACPHDYYRWSIMGVRELCREGDIVDVASRSGPTSALVSQLVTWLAIVLSFGSERLYNVWSMILLVPIAPLKFFDHIFGRFPTALHGTEGFYVIMAKRGGAEEAEGIESTEE